MALFFRFSFLVFSLSKSVMCFCNSIIVLNDLCSSLLFSKIVVFKFVFFHLVDKAIFLIVILILVYLILTFILSLFQLTTKLFQQTNIYCSINVLFNEIIFLK